MSEQNKNKFKIDDYLRKITQTERTRRIIDDSTYGAEQISSNISSENRFDSDISTNNKTESISNTKDSRNTNYNNFELLQAIHSYTDNKIEKVIIPINDAIKDININVHNNDKTISNIQTKLEGFDSGKRINFWGGVISILIAIAALIFPLSFDYHKDDVIKSNNEVLISNDSIKNNIKGLKIIQDTLLRYNKILEETYDNHKTANEKH